MIAGLLEIARDLDLPRGQCYVVHTSDGEVGSQEQQPITEFLRQWEYAIGELDYDDRISCLNTPWLGVVHEDGVVLVPLDPAALREVPF